MDDSVSPEDIRTADVAAPESGNGPASKRPQNIDEIESDAPGSGELSPSGLDDDMEFERRNPGSGGETP